MSAQFFSKLSHNYIELLEDDEYYDITIEVGEDHNVKIFRAHMNILCYRSPYLRRTVGYQKSPDSLFFKTLNRIYSLSSDHKRMNNSLLDSPTQDASNGGKFVFLTSIANE